MLLSDWPLVSSMQKKHWHTPWGRGAWRVPFLPGKDCHCYIYLLSFILAAIACDYKELSYSSYEAEDFLLYSLLFFSLRSTRLLPFPFTCPFPFPSLTEYFILSLCLPTQLHDSVDHMGRELNEEGGAWIFSLRNLWHIVDIDCKSFSLLIIRTDKNKLTNMYKTAHNN